MVVEVVSCRWEIGHPVETVTLCHIIKHNNEVFVASDNLAKHLNICYVPNAIINCDDGINKTQKHCDFKFHSPRSFLIEYN